MHWLLDNFVLVFSGAAVALALFLLKVFGGRSKEFIAKKFMTDNELEFLSRLERAVPEVRFHAQVAMGALLDAAIPRNVNVKKNLRARGKFSQKIVDYAAQDRKTGLVVVLVELDDRTHIASQDERRDDMLAQAGYDVIRWDSRAKPSIKEIRAQIIQYL